MDELSILLTFAVGLAGALLFGYITLRLRLSPIIGYLLAGIAVGPFTPGVVANRAIAEQFAEIGVILLLFGIGLRFHLRELIAVWRLAVPGALIQRTLSTTALAVLLHFMGWTWTAGLILGMAISVASTVVMALVLAEWHDLHAKTGNIAIGWTVVEDILTVALLLLLPIVFAPSGAAGQGIGPVLAVAGIKIASLVAIVVVLGKWVIPWALEQIAHTRSRELFTLAVLVLAVGIAVGSAKIFGVSMALGAFLAGLAVGRSEFAARAANDALPMRDAFAVLFFVSVGMLFDPSSLTQVPEVIVVVLLVVTVVKPLAAALTVRLLGQPLATAIPIGAAFSQVGEFSFILGTVALGLGLINDAGWNALVAASIISIALNPYIYRWARRLSASRAAGRAQAAPLPGPAPDMNRCILVGHGPVGKIVHQLLLDRGARGRCDRPEHRHGSAAPRERPPCFLRRRPATGDPGRRGDRHGRQPHPERGHRERPEIIKNARVLNPGLRILARCAHLRDAAALRKAGATVVAAGEGRGWRGALRGGDGSRPDGLQCRRRTQGGSQAQALRRARGAHRQAQKEE
jgi:CPA2 family monovalent cation:H+ antiporter-2